jgi:hypothetical protein
MPVRAAARACASHALRRALCVDVLDSARTHAHIVSKNVCAQCVHTCIFTTRSSLAANRASSKHSNAARRDASLCARSLVIAAADSVVLPDAGAGARGDTDTSHRRRSVCSELAPGISDT